MHPWIKVFIIFFVNLVDPERFEMIVLIHRINTLVKHENIDQYFGRFLIKKYT